MNYYIQGDAAKADKIKAAFERLGYDISWPEGCANPNVINIGVERNGAKYVVAEASEYIKDIIKTHPDYKELELPVEPKFKVGDWLAANEPNNYARFVYIEGIEDSLYLISKIGGAFGSVDRPCITFVEEYYHPFSINDAKDGDVLVSGIDNPFIYNGNNEFSSVGAYIGISRNGTIKLDMFPSRCWTSATNVKPATKEQRELLFDKIREAGYEWDEKKKELRKIKPHYDIKNFKPFDHCRFKPTETHDWIYADFWYVQAHYKVERLSAIEKWES